MSKIRLAVFSEDLYLTAMSGISGRAHDLEMAKDRSDYGPKLNKIWGCMLDQSQKQDRVEAFTDDQLLQTCHRMETYGGHFCTHIAKAFYAADSGNRATLRAAFADLFIKYGPGGPFDTKPAFGDTEGHGY